MPGLLDPQCFGRVLLESPLLCSVSGHIRKRSACQKILGSAILGTTRRTLRRVCRGLKIPATKPFLVAYNLSKGIESSPLKPTSLFISSNEHRNTTLFVKDGYIPPHRSAFGPPSEQCQSTLVQYKFKSRGSSGSQTTGSGWSWTNGRHIQTHARFKDKHRRLIQGDQGLGIALVAAQKAKVPVILVDTSQASLDKGMKFAGTRSSKDEYLSLVC